MSRLARLDFILTSVSPTSKRYGPIIWDGPSSIYRLDIESRTRAPSSKPLVGKFHKATKSAMQERGAISLLNNLKRDGAQVPSKYL